MAYALTLLTYTVASPDPDPTGGGQLPNPNEYNSTLTSAIREEMLSPNPNECNSTLKSETRDINPILEGGGGANLPPSWFFEYSSETL